MPRETEADRIMRQRTLQGAAQQKANLDAIKKHRRSEVQRRANELAVKIPIVLRLLAEQGYPDMQDVPCLETVSLLGGIMGYKRNRQKAAWLLGTHEINDRYTERDYLFSDGHVSASSDTFPEPTQLQEIVKRDFDAIDYGYRLGQGEDFISHLADGLDELRRKLEGGSKA